MYGAEDMDLQALAQALQGPSAPAQSQQPRGYAPTGLDDPDFMRKIGLLSALSGNHQLVASGQGLVENANQQQQFQSQAPLRNAQAQHAQAQAEQERQKVVASQQETQAMASPEAAGALRGLLSKWGVNVPETTPNATLSHLLPVAEKGYTADQNRQSRADMARLGLQGRLGAAQINQGLQPTAGGAGIAPAADGDGAPAVQPLGGKMLQKRLDELQKDLDASGGRAGEMGKNQARVGAANRVLTLALDENGQPRNLTPQQMPELAQAVASLIANGGTGAQAQIEHLTPHTITGDINSKIQYLMNQPQGAGQQSFVANMAELAKREQAVAQQAMSKARLQRLGRHASLMRSNPDDVAPILSDYGIEIGPDGKPTLAGEQAPAPAAATVKPTHIWNPKTNRPDPVP